MSNELIRTKCDGGVLGCFGWYSCYLDYIEKIRDKNNGKFYCGFCAFKLSRNTRDVIETEYNKELVTKSDPLMMAYVLGALYSCLCKIVVRDRIGFEVKTKDGSKVLRIVDNEYQFTFNFSPVIAGYIDNNKNLLDFIKKNAVETTKPEIPEMTPLEYQYFLCAFFVFSSDIDWSVPSLTAVSDSREFLEKISSKIPVPGVIVKYKQNFELVYSNANFVDFMGLDLFRDVNHDFSDHFNTRKFCENWNCAGGAGAVPEFQWKKVLSEAIAPSKAHFSDSGFDLHLVKKLHSVGNVTYFDTGIAVQCPRGYYFEVYPRSSMTKTGYMLANSVGVIDYGYTNSIIIGLKRDDSCSEITLPARLVQIIPKRLTLMTSKEVTSFSETTRGGGGFGSTGN